MYSDGESWKTWMKDFRFGTLVFLPDGDLRSVTDQLRHHYDPISGRTCAAHITLTQPLSAAPSSEDIVKIEKLAAGFRAFEVQVGPATTSPNRRLVWLDVTPKAPILMLREQLHETGLFRLDLPLTKGFIPHLTISEAQREPEEVASILEHLNAQHEPWNVRFGSVAWIVPDDSFIFRPHMAFPLMEP